MLVRINNRSRWVKDLQILGPGQDIPSKMVDAMELLAIEEERANSEIQSANMALSKTSARNQVEIIDG